MHIDLLRKYPRLLPSALLVLLILMSYWKLTTMQGFIITDDIFTSDIMNAHLPYFHFMSEAIKAGELPLWIPYIYGGFPIFAGGAGIWYPPHLLLFGLLPVYTALNVTLLLALSVAATATFLYAREIGADSAGAAIASVCFAFSGFMVSHLKHVTMVEAASWFPLGLYVIERSIRRPGSGGRRQDGTTIVWIGMIFGLQQLTGFTQLAYYSGLIYLVYFFVRLSHRRVTGLRSRVMEAVRAPLTYWFLGALVLGLGISAVHLIPTAELVSTSHRAEGVSFQYAADYAYDIRDILMFVYPRANGSIADATYRGGSVFWEAYGYAGIITLALAAVAIFRKRREWHVRFFTLIVALSMILVLGSSTPFYEAAYYVIPGMKFFRFPTRLLFLVDFGIAILASVGLGCIAGAKTHNPKKWMRVIALVAVVADLLYFQLPFNPIVDAGQWLTPPETVRFLSGDKSLFRIYSPGADEAHKAAFRIAGGWSGSLQPYVEQRGFLQVNTNAVYDISTPDGYIPLVPNYLVDVWGDMNRPGIIKKTGALHQGMLFVQPAFARLLGMFNVKYLLSPWQIEGEGVVPLSRIGGVHLYQIPAVLPRVYVVHKIRLVADQAQAMESLLADDFDAAREAALFERPSGLVPRDSGSSGAIVERYGMNDVLVKASGDSPGLLVLSDTFYPGWCVECDGVEQPILRANVAQRAVVLTPGTHMFHFVFRPRSFTWGLAVSIVSIVAAATALFVQKRRIQ